jgi:hypothetical protein
VLGGHVGRGHAQGLRLVCHLHQAPVGQVRHRELRHGGQGRVVVERGVEPAAGLGQETHRGFAPLALGDVALDADKAQGRALVVAHREGGEVQVAHRARLVARAHLALHGARARQLARDLGEGLLTQVHGRGAAGDLVRVVAHERAVSVILLEVATVRVDDGDGVGGAGEDLAIKVELVLRPLPFDGIGDVVRDDLGQPHLLGGESVRGIEIHHELAQQVLAGVERDEGQRPDAFAPDGLPEGRQPLVAIHVGHHHRPRATHARRPGRVAFHRAPVRVGQAAPGHEAHHAPGVEEQDGGALRAERGLQGVEREGVDLAHGSGPRDRDGEVVDGAELVGLGRERREGRRGGRLDLTRSGSAHVWPPWHGMPSRRKEIAYHRWSGIGGNGRA